MLTADPFAPQSNARIDVGALELFGKPGATEDLGRQLVNSGRFDWALEEIPEAGIPRIEDRHAVRMAMLMYNQLRHATRPRESAALGIESAAYEDVQTTDLALPTKWALPIIRRIYPAIFDAPFFATQPMPGPLAYAFFMDFTREVDSTDFRFPAPFLVRLSASTLAAATSFTVQQSGKSNPVVVGSYQLAVGQQVTVEPGTGNADTVTISAVNRTTGVVTVGAMTHAHAAGVFALVVTPSAVAEAGVPGKAKMALTRSTVTAQKFMMAATWTTEAMEDARAQLALDIEAEMVQALSVEIGRELFATILTDIVQGATGGSVTIANRGATNVQDYRYLSLQPLYDIEGLVYSKRFHDTDTILAGVDLATNILQQDQFHSTPADDSLMAELGVTHLGDFKGKWQVYKTNFLPPNLGLIFKKPTDWLHSGYVYMPYIPLSPMPLVYAGYNTSGGAYANTDEWTRNIRTRAGRLLTVGDEYGLITQG